MRRGEKREMLAVCSLRERDPQHHQGSCVVVVRSPCFLQEKKKNTYEVDVVTRDSDGGGADAEGEVGEVSAAVEDPAAVDERVLVAQRLAFVSHLGAPERATHAGAVDLVVVGVDDGSGQVDQGRAGVGDTNDAVVGEVITDAVAGGGELPVAGQLGHVDVGQVVLEGGVDEAEVVGAGGLVVQVGGEDGLVEGVQGVGPAMGVSKRETILSGRPGLYATSTAWKNIPEGRLGLGRDGVQAVEAETQEAVHLRLGSEGAGDGLGGLDGLRGHGDTTDGDRVGVDDTAGGGAVTVRDVPGVPAEELGGGGVIRVVRVLAVDVGAGSEGREDPQVRGAGVEVQVQDLGRGADGDGGHVGIVVGVDGGGGGATVVALGVSLEGVLDGSLQPVGDRGPELHVGPVHGQGAVGAVVGTRDLVDRGAALLEVLHLVGGRDGGSSGGAGKGSRGEGLGSDHLGKQKSRGVSQGEEKNGLKAWLRRDLAQRV